MTTPTGSPNFYIKQHDTAPTIAGQITDQFGNAINLTGASVTFIMKLASLGNTGSPLVNAAAVITDAVNSKVSYSWLAADTATAGDYSAEWQVIYATGKKQTFPDPGYLLVRVTADLDGA